MLIAAVILSGCKKNKSDEKTTSVSYNVIYNGTSASGVNEPEILDVDVPFYVPEGMVTRYTSKNFTDDDLEIYRNILKQIGDFKEIVPIITDEASDYARMLDIIRVEQLAFYQVIDRKNRGYNIDTQRFEIELTYRFTPKELNDMNIEIEKAADKIIEGITADMSDYDKLKYLHDYMIKTCESNIEDPLADTIYGVLINRKARCEGYAKAYSYLCNRVGIENMIIMGNTTVYHMWNMVKLDGNWYHVDLTWDKPNIDTYPDMILYQYFMVTDAVIENDHQIWREPVDPPRAYSTKENYFLKENRYVKSEDEFMTITESSFIDAVKGKETTLMLKFDSTDVYLSCLKKLDKSAANNDVATLQAVVDNISKEFGIKLKVNWTDYYSMHRIILFVIEY